MARPQKGAMVGALGRNACNQFAFYCHKKFYYREELWMHMVIRTIPLGKVVRQQDIKFSKHFKTLMPNFPIFSQYLL